MFRKKSSARGCIHLRCLAEMISMVVLVKFWNCYVTFMIQMNTFLNIFDHWVPMCGGVGRCQLRCVVSILGVLLRWSPWSCSWSSGIVMFVFLCQLVDRLTPWKIERQTTQALLFDTPRVFSWLFFFYMKTLLYRIEIVMKMSCTNIFEYTKLNLKCLYYSQDFFGNSQTRLKLSTLILTLLRSELKNSRTGSSGSSRSTKARQIFQ